MISPPNIVVSTLRSSAAARSSRSATRPVIVLAMAGNCSAVAAHAASAAFQDGPASAELKVSAASPEYRQRTLQHGALIERTIASVRFIPTAVSGHSWICDHYFNSSSPICRAAEMGRTAKNELLDRIFTIRDAAVVIAKRRGLGPRATALFIIRALVNCPDENIQMVGDALLAEFGRELNSE